MTKRLNKEVKHRRGRDCFLLGMRDKRKAWLESSHFACGWYWSVGHIEQFTSNNPETARDIERHTHWNSDIIGKQEYYDHEKGCFRQGEYVHHLNENKSFSTTTLTDQESWLLAELMASVYALKEAAEFFGRGGCHLTKNPMADKLKNPSEVKRINEILLPELFNAVYAILTPKEGR
jgi:hypothetical protein